MFRQNLNLLHVWEVFCGWNCVVWRPMKLPTTQDCRTGLINQIFASQWLIYVARSFKWFTLLQHTTQLILFCRIGKSFYTYLKHKTKTKMSAPTLVSNLTYWNALFYLNYVWQSRGKTGTLKSFANLAFNRIVFGPRTLSEWSSNSLNKNLKACSHLLWTCPYSIILYC